MEYFKKIEDALKRDELIGGKVPTTIYNIKAGADVKRGDLLAADNYSAVFNLATATDTAKVFAVAMKDFSYSAEKNVTQGYVTGVFNIQKLNPHDDATINALAPAMFRQGIKLTDLKPFYEEAAE